MIPIIPNNEGYVVGPNGEQLRTPLQQIEKNKDDIAILLKGQQDISGALTDIETLKDDVRTLDTTKLKGGYSYTGIPYVSANQINRTYTISESASGSTIALRPSTGALYAKERVGSNEKDAVVNNYSLMVKMGYSSLSNVNTDGKILTYNPYSDAAFGWVASAPANREGVLQGLPKTQNSYWGFRVCNASKYAQPFTLDNILVWGNYTLLTQLINICTDKIQGEPSVAGNNGFKVMVAPHSSVWIQGRTIMSSSQQKLISQIAIL